MTLNIKDFKFEGVEPVELESEGEEGGSFFGGLVDFVDTTVDTIKQGAANSTLGVAYEMGREGLIVDWVTSPFKGDMSPEIREKRIEYIKKLGLDPDVASNVINVEDDESFLQMATILSDNHQRNVQFYKDAGIGQTLASGLVEGILDPVTLASIAAAPFTGGGSLAATAARAGSIGSKVIKATSMGLSGAAGNVASAGIREELGVEKADYAMAAGSGFVLGSGISLIGDGWKAFRGFSDTSEHIEVRAKTRESAKDPDSPDLSKFSGEIKLDQEYKGRKYMLHPTEEGAVILEDGTIISATNPLNPETVRRYIESNNKYLDVNGMVGLGNLSELSTTLHKSKDARVRNFAAEATPPLAGYKGGGYYPAMTTEDIISYMRSQDNVAIPKAQSQLEKAIREMQVGEPSITRKAALDSIGRKVVESIEGNKKITLTKEEQLLKDQLNDILGKKEEFLKAPNSFGRTDAKPLLKESNYSGEYFPTIYDRGTVSHYREMFGGNEGLQKALKTSYIASYRADPVVKARVDKILKDTINVEGVSDSAEAFIWAKLKKTLERKKPLKSDKIKATESHLNAKLKEKGVPAPIRKELVSRLVAIAKHTKLSDELQKEAERSIKSVIKIKEVTPEILEKYANDKAYGISHNNEFVASSVVDDQLTGLVGIENNDFLANRHGFGNSQKVNIKLENGDVVEFAPNDLRSYDIIPILSQYSNRINGDIAIMGSMGKTTRELKNEITELRQLATNEKNPKLKREVKAMEEFVKLATGRGRKDPDTVGETLMRSLMDLTLFSRGNYIAAMNFLEAVPILTNGTYRAIIQQIPILREFTKVNKVVSKEELDGFHRALAGKELDDSIRPSRDDIINRLRETSDSSDLAIKLAGNTRYLGQELTSGRYSPIRLIGGTTNLLIDTARKGLLGDIMGEALGAKGVSKWSSEKMLRAARITRSQYDGILAFIRENASLGKDGRYAFSDLDSLSSDPRMFDLWRYADAISKEVILQPHRIGWQQEKAFNAYVDTALMFKRFMLRSLNGRTLHSWYQATRNGRALEIGFLLLLDMSANCMFQIARTNVTAAGMPPVKAEKYRQQNLDPNVLALGSIMRSSQLTGVTGLSTTVMNLFGADITQNLRTTTSSPYLAKEGKLYDKGSRGYQLASEFGGRLAREVPVLGTVSTGVSLTSNAFNALTSPNAATKISAGAGVSADLQGIFPNIPGLNVALLKIFESAGLPVEQQ